MGSEHLLESAGVQIMTEATLSGVHVALDGTYAGSIQLADQAKPGAAQAVQALQSMGMQVVMLTGDASPEAHRVASDLGIGDVRSELLPTRRWRLWSRSWQKKDPG